MQAGLDYQIADGLTAGINVSYDEAFETRVSGNVSYRFGSNRSAAEIKKKAWQKPTIQALSERVKNRNIRVHDDAARHCYTPSDRMNKRTNPIAVSVTKRAGSEYGMPIYVHCNGYYDAPYGRQSLASWLGWDYVQRP